MFNKLSAAAILCGACFAFSPTVSPGQTTTSLGQIVITDPNILDLTGSYFLHDDDFRLELHITQDLYGDLTATGTLVSDESDFEQEIGPFFFDGEVWIHKQKELRFRLYGFVREDRDDLFDNGANADVEVWLDGKLKDAAFDTDIEIRRTEFNDGWIEDVDHEHWDENVVPVNPTRGVVISDGPGRMTSPTTLESTRTVTIAGSTIIGNAYQVNYSTGKASFVVDAGYEFQFQAGGRPYNGALSVKQAKVTFPYGRLKLKPSSVQTSPTQFPQQ